MGIRLDSGDLAYLAVQAARELDTAGFPDTVIVLSSQLDELTIWQITAQIVTESRRHGLDPDAVIGRLVLGAGSRLATSHGDPSLDGVFKLVAVDDGTGNVATGDQAVGLTGQGAQPGAEATVAALRRARRRHRRRAVDRRGDASDQDRCTCTITRAPDVSRTVVAGAVDELLERIVEGGAVVVDGGQDALDDVAAAAARRVADVDRFDPGVRRLVNPHDYHVSITDDVHALKRRLLERF